MDRQNRLWKVPKEQYGEKFQDHCLEIYKMYVEATNQISDRRQAANSFFLSINTAIVGLVGYVQSDSSRKTFLLFYLLISIAGMLISYTWYRLILSYQQINSGKFKVIHLIEEELPLSPYDAEWETLGRGDNPKKYLPFTQIEIIVPWVFFGINVVLFLSAIWNLII